MLIVKLVLIRQIGGWGDEHNREIVSCRAVRGVRACARSGCLVEFGLKSGCWPFSLLAAGGFPLSLVGLQCDQMHSIGL